MEVRVEGVKCVKAKREGKGGIYVIWLGNEEEKNGDRREKKVKRK